MSENRVTGIGGVFFKAHNPQHLAAWYSEHLGLPLEVSAENDYRVADLDALLSVLREEGV